MDNRIKTIKPSDDHRSNEYLQEAMNEGLGTFARRDQDGGYSNIRYEEVSL